jgi:glutathione synthase/RimK-type ligase-like ATP-grasp enzyme
MFFEFIFNLLPEEKVINNFYDFKNTKLNQLLKAYECGLTIPKTYITNSKEQLTNIIEEKSSYITKAMYEGIGFNINEDSYTTYTSRININQFSSNIFLPSLVQKEITKKYEVRTFILGKKDYSMAIFSQGNRQTEVDYRQYDSSVPNKKAPFALPEMIKEKVLSLMDKMNLKTGSIDFIVDMDDNYYFLEINPYGQFGMVSIPNNYNLEHEFAKYLMEYE